MGISAAVRAVGIVVVAGGQVVVATPAVRHLVTAARHSLHAVIPRQAGNDAARRATINNNSVACLATAVNGNAESVSSVGIEAFNSVAVGAARAHLAAVSHVHDNETRGTARPCQRQTAAGGLRGIHRQTAHRHATGQLLDGHIVNIPVITRPSGFGAQGHTGTGRSGGKHNSLLSISRRAPADKFSVVERRQRRVGRSVSYIGNITHREISTAAIVAFRTQPKLHLQGVGLDRGGRQHNEVARSATEVEIHAAVVREGGAVLHLYSAGTHFGPAVGSGIGSAILESPSIGNGLDIGARRTAAHSHSVAIVATAAIHYHTEGIARVGSKILNGVAVGSAVTH